MNTGVRQGSVLSPLLFIVYMNQVILQIEQENFKLERFGYADDVAQTADSIHNLQDVMNCWDEKLTAAGLKLNYNKIFSCQNMIFHLMDNCIYKYFS